jgi:hypothetical protein
MHIITTARPSEEVESDSTGKEKYLDLETEAARAPTKE